MSTVVEIDLDSIARELRLDLKKVVATVELLDQGNTIPFITRYRKDATGGLDETQVRAVKETLAQQKALLERRAFILKSIESQNQLSPELRDKIERARTLKHLEDLYLPYKPKKQTLATTARQKGLEPLANDIFDGREPDIDLATRATDFVRVDKGLNSVDEVIQGVGHLLAERFSERADLRYRLRKSLWQKGKIITQGVNPEPSDSNTAKDISSSNIDHKPISGTHDQNEEESKPTGSQVDKIESCTNNQIEADGNGPEALPGERLSDNQNDGNELVDKATTLAPVDNSPVVAQSTSNDPPPNAHPEESPNESNDGNAETDDSDLSGDHPTQEMQAATSEDSSKEIVDEPEMSNEASHTDMNSSNTANEQKKKKKKKKKKKPAQENPFLDYQDYAEKLDKIPPHRILAINRGERAKLLRVKIEGDSSEIESIAEKRLVEDNHPFADFLKTCVKDALNRLILPSLEREIRRELTERSENHAVEVFARNLRSLLLQPPVHGHRALAIDPGFRSGCKLAVIDQYGKFISSNVLHLVGNEEKRNESRKWLVDAINEHAVSVIAIGNGTACRQTEQLVSDILASDLKESTVQYVIVNEAGASVYSTSDVGREELPDHDPVFRSAISIGRRLLDPLSELVKINPANIGVGLYQHDVKAKHLGESLDEVVESCVNFVGVDANTASPALLSHVAGLNQLTARRMFEYRQEHGPFTSREQFKLVNGFGDATFLQSAGFLRIPKGENPFDATSIHPESYDLAQKILEKYGADPQSLLPLKPLQQGETEEIPSVDKTSLDKAKDSNSLTDVRKTLKEVNPRQLAEEFGVGQHLIKDILKAIIRPGRDPREDLPPPIFRTGILKFEDLRPEMQLKARVLNVVDFGVFVDIGVGESSMIHVSRLSSRYVNDPHQLFAVGDTLDVWVIDIDKDRRRVNLTAIRPGTQKPSYRPKRDQNLAEETTGAGEKKKGAKYPSRSKKPINKKGQGKPNSSRRNRTAKPKKPAKPITKEMIEGTEPMRTFGDLAQLFELDKPSKDKKKDDA